MLTAIVYNCLYFTNFCE